VTAERQDDVYAVLGVNRQATPTDIERAYRRAARATHPDARPEDPAAAAEEFKSVTAAYETLRDPARRAAYDRSHPIRQRPSSWTGSASPVPRSRRLRVDPPRHASSPPPLWAGPVEIVPPLRPAPSWPAADEELVRLAALVRRLLRSPW
jgi:hypothetical protein